MAKAPPAISGRAAVTGSVAATDHPGMSLRDKLVELAWARWQLKEQAAAAPRPGPKSGPVR